MSRSSQARRERRQRVAAGVMLAKPKPAPFKRSDVRASTAAEVADKRSQLYREPLKTRGNPQRRLPGSAGSGER